MSSQQEPWQSDPQLAQLLKLSTWTAAQAAQILQMQRQSGLSLFVFSIVAWIKLGKEGKVEHATNGKMYQTQVQFRLQALKRNDLGEMCARLLF